MTNQIADIFCPLDTPSLETAKDWAGKLAGHVGKSSEDAVTDRSEALAGQPAGEPEYADTATCPGQAEHERG